MWPALAIIAFVIFWGWESYLDHKQEMARIEHKKDDPEMRSGDVD